MKGIVMGRSLPMVHFMLFPGPAVSHGDHGQVTKYYLRAHGKHSLQQVSALLRLQLQFSVCPPCLLCPQIPCLRRQHG